MVKVRITSETAVTVGQRVRLPGEVHQLHPAMFAAAVALYGADAFRVLDGEPVAGEPVADESATVEADSEPVADEPAEDERPTRRRKASEQA